MNAIRVGKQLLTAAFRCVASLALAVILLATLAAVLAVATIVESRHGTPYAHWYVYDSGWFVGLLALLGVNIFSAAAIRFPWKRYQTGFVLTHAGLLVLLTGSIQTFLGGVEGRVSLVEGEATQHMTDNHRGQITAFWVGRPNEPPFEFAFDAGPVDWPTGKSLDVGEIDGVRTRVLGYLVRPRAVETWVPDEAKLGGPVVKFKLTGHDDKKVADGWLVDQQFGDAVLLGPLRLQLERAATDRMLDDFLQPPSEKLGEKGLLAMYYGDAVEHVSLDQPLGRRIMLGKTGVEVEIMEYLPNAVPDKLGQFVTKGDSPKNPMVELRVHLPGDAEPLRQIAFAKDALLNLDGVYPRLCPVKFRFHHPAVQPQTAFELLQTSDGKLHSRFCSNGECKSFGEVKSGSKFKLPGNFNLEFAEHQPHSRQAVTFVATDREDMKTAATAVADKIEPAALIEIHAGGQSQQMWLHRNDPTHGQRTIETPAGTLALKYEHEKVPLGFALTLLEFRRDLNPGNAGNAGFSSRVKVLDRARGIEREETIAMNEPLIQGKFRFYQSGFDDTGHGKAISRFSVVRDPGRMLKYTGSLMICLGIGMMFYMRAYFFLPPQTPDDNVAESAMPTRSTAASDRVE